MSLARRYARWAALCYPPGPRRSELVDTYLALAEPGRSRPSPADVADLAAGGLRQHVRLATGLGPGARLAGVLALMTATAFATGWMLLEVLAPRAPWHPPVGPFVSLGVAVWAAWLLAVAAPPRWFRPALGAALLATAAVVPAALLTGLPRPPLSVLLPQFVLGVVALGATARGRSRFLPIAAAAAGALVALATSPGTSYFGDYYRIATGALPAAAVTLLAGAVLLALGLAARRDVRGAWSLLILLTPIGMLAAIPLATLFDGSGPVLPGMPAMISASLLVAAAGPALLALTLATRGRLPTRSPEPEKPACPT